MIADPLIADFGLRIADLMVLAQISPEQGVKLVDAINQKNDRWLFIALLVVFILSIGWLIKWGTTQLEKRDVKIEAMGKELGEIRDKHAVTMMQFAEKFAGIVQENSRAFAGLSQAMKTSTVPTVEDLNLRNQR